MFLRMISRANRTCLPQHEHGHLARCRARPRAVRPDAAHVLGRVPREVEEDHVATRPAASSPLRGAVGAHEHHGRLASATRRRQRTRPARDSLRRIRGQRGVVRHRGLTARLSRSARREHVLQRADTSRSCCRRAASAAPAPPLPLLPLRFSRSASSSCSKRAGTCGRTRSGRPRRSPAGAVHQALEQAPRPGGAGRGLARRAAPPVEKTPRSCRRTSSGYGRGDQHELGSAARFSRRERRVAEGRAPARRTRTSRRARRRTRP